ncbi:MAG: glycoside hydrolase family 35 protein [Spirochaetia bacterium]
MSRFTVSENRFLLDGKDFRIISGAFHYFRCLQSGWDDILWKMKAFGCNTVETYIPWSLHEEEKGVFTFADNLDLEAFIQKVDNADMKLILRPGPYICAEFDGGALPGWLLSDKFLRIRCSHPGFINHVREYFNKILPIISKYQIDNNGPVIMVQLENEYGGYGNDASYLHSLMEMYKYHKITVPVFTSDQPIPWMLENGSIPGVLKTANFGSRAKERFQKLAQIQPNRPLFCAEFWVGWFDSWGNAHHERAAQDTAEAFDQLLETGGSVNIYMFFGGTNFGYTPGANHKLGEPFEADVTSYDYSALLAEDGSITEKYLRMRSVLEKHIDLPELPSFANTKYLSETSAEVTAGADLFANLDRISQKVSSPYTMDMEEISCYKGFCLYRTRVTGPRTGEIAIPGVQDWAAVYLDAKQQGEIFINDPKPSMKLSIPAGEHTLDILLENLGHVNFGFRTMDRKGITQGVTLDGAMLHNWEIYPLPFEYTHIQRIEYLPSFSGQGPCFVQAVFNADNPGSAYLDCSSLGKGNAFINGFHLGRFWNKGPQLDLYIPGSLIQQRRNTIDLFCCKHLENLPKTLLLKPARTYRR